MKSSAKRSLPALPVVLMLLAGLGQAQADEPVTVSFDSEKAWSDLKEWNELFNDTLPLMEARVPPPSDSAYVYYHNESLWVSAQAHLGLPFRLFFFDLPEAWLDYELSVGPDIWDLDYPIHEPDVLIPDVPFQEGDYEVTIRNKLDKHQTAGFTLTLTKVSPCAVQGHTLGAANHHGSKLPGEPSADANCVNPETYQYQSPRDPCHAFQTLSHSTGGLLQADAATTVSTAAHDLSWWGAQDNWKYWKRNPDGSVSQDTTVADAWSAAFGFYGANRYTYGNTFYVGFAGSWEGNEDTTLYYNSLCDGYVAVGHEVTVWGAQAFYVDPNVIGGNPRMIVTYEDPAEMGYPAESCNKPLQPIQGYVEAALELTQVGGYIAAGVPDEYCVKNWRIIDTDNYGHPGNGVHAYHPSSDDGNYAGITGQLGTHYSSTGEFKMALEGNANIEAYFRACATCTASRHYYQATVVPLIDAQVRP